MTPAEQAELRLVVRLTKWALGIGFLAAVSFGMWVAQLQGQVAKIPALEAQSLNNTRAIEDLVLLRCADTTLNTVAKRICAKYEPRMPR